MCEQKYPIQVSGTCNKPEKNTTYHLLIEYVTRCKVSLPGRKNSQCRPPPAAGAFIKSK